eukprot:TRINITY_DN4142_c0_g4_i1.p1 TRINITY_DN4142_c0_g4~~TRINITY_DN4142_c0_g4_i1.p1  ORF type:complete len:1401 (-),score=353.88 TRINITY_DN4142_c0_g4_i1:71-4240(-)
MCNAGMAYSVDLLDQVYFAHDKVQEAAYNNPNVLSEDKKRKAHLKIAHMLLRHYPLDQHQEKLFDVVDHYNAAANILSDPQEILKVIELNQKAGHRAKAATAYASALAYFNIAISYMDKSTTWTNHYSMTYESYKQKAELEYLTSNYQASEETISHILEHTKTDIDKAQVLVFLVMQKTILSVNDQAIKHGKTALGLLGYQLPDADWKAEAERQNAAAHASLQSFESVEKLGELPDLKDPVQATAFQIMAALMAPTCLFDRNLYYVLVPLAINLILRYGSTSDTPVAFTFFGAILSEKPQMTKLGYEFGMLGIRTAEKYDLPAQKSIIYFLVGTFIYHKHRGLRESLETCYHKGFQSGLASGERIYSVYSAFYKVSIPLLCGDPLESVMEIAQTSTEYAEKCKGNLTIRNIKILKYAAKNLCTYIEKEETDEMIKQLDGYSICWFRFFGAQRSYLLGDYRAALADAIEANKNSLFHSGHYVLNEINFYWSLSLTALCDIATAEELDEFRTQLTKNQDALKIQFESCPPNIAHKYHLVAAEIARLDRNNWEASRLYSQAISEAEANGFLIDLAVANELAAKFWISHREEKIAVVYLTESIQGFSRWGAKLKMKKMQDDYDTIFAKTKTPEQTTATPVTSTTNVSSVLLDMSSVVKASQVISSDIDIRKLLFNMMRVIIETAGAQRGALLLLKDDVLSVHAEYTSQGEIKVLEEIDLKEWKGSQSVIEYVRNTSRSVVLGRAVDDKQFGSELYICESGVLSLLCMPILKQDELKGILYVENNLASFAFPTSRVSVLSILASQMAISLENALLVNHQLESLSKVSEEQRKRALEAESYKKSLEEFIDTICHEMRNPLNGIYGGTTLLQDQIADVLGLAKRAPAEISEALRASLAVASEHLDSINKCAEQQKVIVDDVLDLSRIESNRIELNPCWFEVKTLIKTILQMLSPRILQSNLDVIVNIEEQAGWLKADVHRLSQILINLLSNAIKFSFKNGFIEINLSIKELHTGVAELHVAVRDTGIGMTPEEKNGLFMRFSQGSKFIETRYGGSGLGLVISKKLIERMQGKISVDTKKWHGSVFRFFVLCEVSTEPLRKRARTASPKEVYEAPQNATILVVEDNAVNQKLLLHYLQPKGYFCEVANNGEEALAKVEAMQFDLIYMDIEMPVMGGLEATRRIRELEKEKKRNRTPIVGLSGNARAAQVEEAIESGMDDYLTKPFHRDDIFKMLGKHVGRGAATAVPMSLENFDSGSSDAVVAATITKSPEFSRHHISRKSSGSPIFRTFSPLLSDTRLKFHCFRCAIPDASSVHIAGDFNKWLRDSAGNLKFDDETSWYEMKRGSDGIWKINLPLDSGTFGFHYLVNRGERIVDDSSPLYSKTSLGVVTVNVEPNG